MNILITEKYKIVCKGKIFYNTPSYDEPNDWHTENVKWQKTLNGADVIKFFNEQLQLDDLWECHIEDNKVYLGYFKPETGEGSDFTYTITFVPNREDVKNYVGYTKIEIGE